MATLRLNDLMFVLAVALIATLTIHSDPAKGAPSATYKGGHYYLYVNQERVEGYYTQDYTAKAAAVNLSFTCNCTVIIEQPAITVNTTGGGTNTATLKWMAPVKREDGTDLDHSDISGYTILEQGPEGDIGYEVNISDIPEGNYRYSMQAEDSTGNMSKVSNVVSKEQP